ncbi:cytochrome P450 [Scleroderma citrinum]
MAAPWLTYEKLGKKHGGIIYSKLLGMDFIVINSEKVALELLEQRSAIYSDRPYLVPLKLFGLDFNTATMPYGDTWRQHRRMFHFAFNREASKKYSSIQIKKVKHLLAQLLTTPWDYAKHLDTFSAAIIMAITYDYEVAPQNDPCVTKISRMVEVAVEVATPERSALLGSLPLLAYIPHWFPGGGYKRRKEEICRLARDVLDEPVKYVEDCIVAGTAKKSMVFDLFQKRFVKDSSLDQEEAIKAMAATVFSPGAETTGSTIRVFLLAMVLYPEIQSRAQEELDKVVGTDRLPNFTDRENLPYIEAILLETLHWYPVAPLGIPHRTTTRDEYNGMCIPKGEPLLRCTLVNVNSKHPRAMTHDEGRFPEPAVFKPERHLTLSGTLAEGTLSHTFGFGRRICPGRYIADRTIWLAVASMLATLRIEEAKDKAGNGIPVKPDFTSGLAIRPKPFACSIKARSLETALLIHRAATPSNSELS